MPVVRGRIHGEKSLSTTVWLCYLSAFNLDSRVESGGWKEEVTLPASKRLEAPGNNLFPFYFLPIFSPVVLNCLEIMSELEAKKGSIQDQRQRIVTNNFPEKMEDVVPAGEFTDDASQSAILTRLSFKKKLKKSLSPRSRMAR